MKIQDQVKRQERYKRKIIIRSKNKISVPRILLNKTQQKPLTVRNGVIRRIFVVGQPVDVMTNYTQI